MNVHSLSNPRGIVPLEACLSPFPSRKVVLPLMPHPNRPPFQTDLLRNFPAARRYLVGVSGGRDSVVLLHWLHSLGFQKLIVCHLDHRLRGRASAADARFVARLADSLGCQFTGGVADVRAVAKRQKRSLETAAREARFQFFAKVAKARRCRTIFLAHHADDLVETFLLNLFRGAGMTGLGGIREISRQRIGRTELTIVRPLLGVWRSEIDDHVRRISIAFPRRRLESRSRSIAQPAETSGHSVS